MLTWEDSGWNVQQGARAAKSDEASAQARGHGTPARVLERRPRGDMEPLEHAVAGMCWLGGFLAGMLAEAPARPPVLGEAPARPPAPRGAPATMSAGACECAQAFGGREHIC